MSGVFNAVLSGSMLIAVLALVRMIAGKWLPKALLPTLWCIAAVRLLLPVGLPSRLSIWNLLRTQTAKTPSTAQVAETLVPFSAVQTGSAVAAQTQRQGSWLLLLWAAGTLLLAAYILVGYVRFVRRFSRTATPISMQELPETDRLPGWILPRIRVTTLPCQPLTYGLVRPVVLLPVEVLADRQTLRMILTHELAHIRRRDCLRKLLFTVCLCLYWWNPLCWAMVYFANRDIELACDALVLKQLGEDRRKDYARTLLELAARQARPQPLCSSFGRPAAEERIQAIMKVKKLPLWLAMITVILLGMLVTVFATQAQPIALEVPQEASVEELQSPQALPQEQESLPEAAEEADAEAETQTAPEEAVQETPGYVFPLEDPDTLITNPYGVKRHPVTQQESMHDGVDLDAPEGANVLAVADGTVTACEYDAAYAHLQQQLVSAGDIVQQGQVIGLVGASGWTTGPHLHLAVRINGESVDPLAALQ